MMNEETDQFERRLSRQPLRQIPTEWRAEIVGQASSLSPLEKTKKMETGKMPVLLSFCRDLLWPHPKAWAGLAAVWILIFAVDFSVRDKSPVTAEKAAPPSPEVIAELRQQQRMLAELIGSSQAREAELPRFLPLPRSERVGVLMT
jgi:hypothetical protein